MNLFRQFIVVIMIGVFIATMPVRTEAGSNKSAKLGVAMAVVGIGLNTYMIAKNIGPCTATPMGVMACVIVALSAVQIVFTTKYLMDLTKADKATTCKGADCGAGTFTEVTTTTLGGIDDGNGNDGIDDTIDDVARDVGLDIDRSHRDAENTLRDLERRGVVYNKEDGSITTPRGKVSASSLSSPSAMKAAGFSDKDISQYMKAQEEAQKKADDYSGILKKFGVDEGESGGGMAPSGGESAGAPGFDFNKFMKGLNQKPAKEKQTVAGLSKSDGKGGQIGVAADSLFEMVHRRYKSERDMNKFIDGAK